MLTATTLQDIIGVLETDATFDDLAAHLAHENHNRDYAEARLARAARLRRYIREIQDHLSAPPATPGDDAIVN